jgi:hypothetical protein
LYGFVSRDLITDRSRPTVAARPQGRFRLGRRNQVVVGDIPRAVLLSPGGLLRAGPRAQVLVIHAVTGCTAWARRSWRPHTRGKLAAGWRLVAWVNGADTGSLLRDPGGGG